MRARLAGFTSIALAGVLVHCSLLVDTDGLSGGAKDDAGPGTGSDSPFSETGPGAGDGATTDVGTAPGGLGPLWLAYGTTAGAMGVRQWNDTQWSAELPGPTVQGAVRWVVAKETPAGSFLAVLS